MIAAIVAISDNDIIGKDAGLPWKLSGDLQYFKKITTGKTIVMGRKTWESLGNKPLPNRRNIVVSSQPQTSKSGEEWATSLTAALEICKGDAEVFLIGGAKLFEAAFAENLVEKIYLTRVHADVEGDIVFHIPKKEEWKIVSVDAKQADDKNEHAYTFLVLEQKIKND